MKGGFSFKGVDVASLFLMYVPEKEDTYVYRPTNVRIHEETFDGHHGGYFYGASKDPKEMVLRCYFEEHSINSGLLEKVHWLFRKGSSGKLIFQKRPWCYYYATVTDVDDKELFNYRNGIIKVTVKAYYPFARSDVLQYPSNGIYYKSVMNSTAFLDEKYTLPETNLISETPLTTPTSFLLYNPGNEYAGVGIEIAGEAPEGVIIQNKTTEQEIKFVALTNEITEVCWIYYDGINGKTLMRSEYTDRTTGDTTIISKENSLYHDHGFIQLAPAYPIIRDIYVRHIAGSTAVTVNCLYDEKEENADSANEWYHGKYIYLNGKWIKIKKLINEHSLQLEESATSSIAQKTSIVQMNELIVKPVVAMSLTRLRFLYRPTFA